MTNTTVWEQIINNLPLPARALVKDHCILLNIKEYNNSMEIVLGIKNKALRPFVLKHENELKKSLYNVIGIKSKIIIHEIDTATFNKKSNHKI